MPAVSFRAYRLPGCDSRGRDRRHAPPSARFGLRLRPCVRLLPQTARSGQPSSLGAVLDQDGARVCTVQTGVAAAMSALPAPSLQSSRSDKAKAFVACWLSPSRDPVGVCSMGPPLSASSTTLYRPANAGQSPSSRGILCHASHATWSLQVPCNPGRLCPIESTVKREAQSIILFNIFTCFR